MVAPAGGNMNIKLQIITQKLRKVSSFTLGGGTSANKRNESRSATISVLDYSSNGGVH